MKIYTIYDKIAKQAAPPFASTNDEAAARSFAASLAQVPTLPKQDYTLLCIGEYDVDNPIGEVVCDGDHIVLPVPDPEVLAEVK